MAYARLHGSSGPHTVDLFATELSIRCVQFNSSDQTPGALKIYALHHAWEHENPWANPPFHLLGPGRDKIIRENAMVTVVAPFSRPQPWWARGLEACTEAQKVPEVEGVYRQKAHTRTTSAPPPFGRTAVFRFEASQACAMTRPTGASSLAAS